jgi:hypothetical protein
MRKQFLGPVLNLLQKLTNVSLVEITKSVGAVSQITSDGAVEVFVYYPLEG